MKIEESFETDEIIKFWPRIAATMTNEDSWKKASKASKKRVVRTGGGQIWEDETLKDWDPNDYRVFCGDLGNDVTDEVNPYSSNKHYQNLIEIVLGVKGVCLTIFQNETTVVHDFYGKNRRGEIFRLVMLCGKAMIDCAWV